MYLKKILFVFFILVASLANAQDVIIKKNGNRINCRIVGIDSTFIKYSVNNVSEVLQVQRSEVANYFLSKKTEQELFHHPAPEPDTIGRAMQGENIPAKRKKRELFIISAEAGFGIPLGEFADMDPDEITAGLAKKGGVLKAMVTFKVFDFLGLSAGYKYQWHPFNDRVIRNYLAYLYPTLNFSTESTPWIIQGFFGGLHLNLPLKKVKGLSATFDAMASIPKYFLPKLETVAYNNLGSVMVTQYSASAYAFTYFGGPGLRYKASQHFAFNASVHYQKGEVAFTQIYTKSSNGYFSYDDYKQKVTTLNINAGITYLIYNQR